MYSNLERERERENKRRKQENLAPLNDGGVGSSSSSLGFSPRYAISWLDIFSFFILLLLFYFFTPGFWWSDSRVHRFLKDAWSTSWINQGPSTKDFVFPSCSIKDRCSGCLVFQQQAYFFFCLRPTRHQSPSQNTGWIRIGLELFLLIFPVGGSWLPRQEQPVHYISLNTYIGDQERGRPCFF